MSSPFRLRDPRDGRVHFSLAKRIATSAAHAKHGCLHPKDPTPAMTFGSIVDAMLMPVPGRSVREFAGARRAGKEWDAFVSSCKPGDLLAKGDEIIRATACALSVMHDPVVCELRLLSGEHQRVVQWDMHGLPWATGIAGDRGGFDLLGEDWIADIKTTTTTEPRAWSRQARRMLYPEQLAAYRMAASSIGRRIKNCYIVGVEVKPPFCVTVLRVPEQDLEAGERTLYSWCERIKQCEAADSWPGYVQAPVDLDPKDEWASLLEEES